MPIEFRLEGSVHQVLIGSERDSLVTARRHEAEVTFAGFGGDRHAGMTRLSDARTPHYARGTEIRNERQVSIVSAEELGEIATELGVAALEAAWLGANLLIADVPRLTMLPPNTRFIFPGGAVLVSQGENLPCMGPGKVIEAQTGRPELAIRFPSIALHRRGLVACVEKPGIVREGDSVAIEVPEQRVYRPHQRLMVS